MVILRLDRRIHETIFRPAIKSQDDDWGFKEVRLYHFHGFRVMPLHHEDCGYILTK
jgi:hypothetical protein